MRTSCAPCSLSAFRSAKKVIVKCDTLTRRLSTEPDYLRTEADGRVMSVLIRYSHAIVYWINHGERLIFISRIDPSDKAARVAQKAFALENL
jgi:hypothetical protein